MRSRDPHLRRRWWLRPGGRALLLLLLLAVLAASLVAGARARTDFLWFREVGQEQVFWTRLTGRWLFGAFAGVGTTALLLANAWLAGRLAPASAERPRHDGKLAWLRAAAQPAYVVVSVAFGLTVAESILSFDWQRLLLWQHRSDFGLTDPVFGYDVGFFVFSLPLYERAATWMSVLVILALCGAFVAHVLTGAIRFGRGQLLATRAAHLHVLLLGALLLLVMAWQLRLDQFALVLPHGGTPANGAGYTDVHVRLPWLRALVAVHLLGATLLVYAAVRRSRTTPVFVFAMVVVAQLFNPATLPPLVQRFLVDPQTLSRERPYIADSIAMTRVAYGLERVRQSPVPAGGFISQDELDANRDVLRNVQLWDTGVLRKEIDQQQALGAYYRFGRVTVDRYRDLDGRRTQMLVAARELDLRRLSKRGRTWANDHLAYTHGFGLVGVPAGGVDAGGKPTFVTSEFGAGQPPISLRQPRIYFGEQPRHAQKWVIANTKRGEVERPESGDAPTSRYHYGDTGGIELSSIARRALFAIREGDLDILLSKTLTPESRFVMHRDVHERLRTVAPFLQWEDKAEVVVVGGRIQYLVHGYTSSDTFPYSERTRLGRRRANYVRSPVDATVDASSGRLTLYARPEDDPIVRAWQRAFPTLFTPHERMPAELRRHLRYPRRLFTLQARIWEAYHAGDVDHFYVNDDTFRRPPDVSGRVQDVGTLGNRTENDRPLTTPELILARLPGERAKRFMLATPFTPNKQENLSSFFTGRVEWDGRREITELSLPRSRVVLGPAQASRQIFASPEISETLRLLNQEASDLGDRAVNTVQLGKLRMVPVGDGFLYVKPFYITSQVAGITKLRLVGVHLNGQVGSGRTLEEAIDDAQAGAQKAVEPERFGS
jgi:uncharacterized protein